MTEHIPVFVGITTIPSRIQFMQPCLKSLLDGTLVPDRIFVSVPETSLREQTGYEIPGFFSKPEFAGKIEIIRTKQDDGPGTKLLGMLPKIIQPSYVVIADDDVVYKPFFLQGLIEHQRLDHDSSFSYFAFSLGGMRCGQGVDGFSFWSPHLAGIADFYQAHIAGTDMMFHDDMWISFYLMTQGIKIKSLAHRVDGGEAKEVIHSINALLAETGRLSRSKLNSLVSTLFREVEVPKNILREFLLCAPDSPCICGSGKAYKDCHGEVEA